MKLRVKRNTRILGYKFSEAEESEDVGCECNTTVKVWRPSSNEVNVWMDFIVQKDLGEAREKAEKVEKTESDSGNYHRKRPNTVKYRVNDLQEKANKYENIIVSFVNSLDPFFNDRICCCLAIYCFLNNIFSGQFDSCTLLYLSTA